MRIGILSDAHGNYEATKMCLDLLKNEKCEEIYFLGDMIGYFPECLEVYNLLKDYNVFCIKGNHESLIKFLNDNTENIIKHDNCRKVLSEEIIDEMYNLPEFIIKNINLNNYIFIHSYDCFENIVLKPSPFAEKLNIFIGHTHRACIWKDLSFNKIKKIVNVGSCGYPRDNTDMVSCCLVDTDRNFNDNIKIFKIKFDFKTFIEKYNDQIHENVKKYFLRNL